jgi:hypothetical protein
MIARFDAACGAVEDHFRHGRETVLLGDSGRGRRYLRA